MLFKNTARIPCRHCGKTMEENQNDKSFFVNERHDYYGISTGYWCEDCYENHYTYRKDAYYDYLNAGEYLNDDY